MAGYPVWILVGAVVVGCVRATVDLSTIRHNPLNIPTPPGVFLPGRQMPVYVESSHNITLLCNATGTPHPTYEWQWNGQAIMSNDTKASVDSTTGTLTLPRFSRTQEGYYQCLASNRHGVSLSQIVEVRKRVDPKFTNDPGSREVTTVEGEGARLECYDRPEGRPPGIHTWYHVVGNTQQQIQVDSNPRYDMGKDGALYITNTVKSEDEATTYACAVSSVEQGYVSVAKTPYLSLNVDDRNQVHELKPKLLGFSNFVTADIGGEAALECFFGGLPQPAIKWKDTRNKEIRSGINNRYISSKGHKLTIRRLNSDDEGSYTCEAFNTLGTETATVFLNVTSPPLFTTSSPQRLVSPVGSDVTFTCLTKTAFQEHSLNPVWTVNGGDVPANNEKFRLSADDTKLTVLNVTKDDVMCIQCNVTNSRGYAFGDGYLLVIDPLKIVSRPNNTLEIEPRTSEVNLTIQATSDACCPLQFAWSLDGQELTTTALHKHPYRYITGLNTVSLIMQVADGKEEDVMGTYRCDVWHRAYSTNKTLTVTLRLKELPEPDKEKVSQAGSNYWWIGLAGGLVVFICAIVIIALMVHYNYPRQEYLLEKEEKKHKLNPEQDLMDQSFEEI